MTVLLYRGGDSFKEAAGLALEEVGVGGVSQETMELTATVADPAKLRPLAEVAILGAVRRRWAKARFHERRRHYVAVPWLKYDAKGIPTLILETQACVVAAGKVALPTDASYQVVVAEAVGKPERQALPLNLLYSLANGSYGAYAVLERDGPWITWNMAGFEHGVRLHSGLVEGICQVLRYRQSVNAWLRSFGPRGETVAPYVIGYLLGLLCQSEGRRLLPGEQGVTHEELMAGIESLGYSEAEAKDMIRAALPQLAGVSVLEEAMQIVLKVHGRRREGGA